MTKIEALQHIIDSDGDCHGLTCYACPLNSCIDRSESKGLGEIEINIACVYMAQELLNQIVENKLLGITNDES